MVVTDVGMAMITGFKGISIYNRYRSGDGDGDEKSAGGKGVVIPYCTN